ncbi:MAG: hypothetical protein ABMB14_21895 [Myxococcota bacterium]
MWRLGVLLAEILTGGPPAAATDRVAHELMIRRLMIRIMSRPGPMFPERYRDWVAGMLAWDADQRPVLARVAPGLRELAHTLAGPTLASWAGGRIADLRLRAERAPRIDPSLELGPAPVTETSTVPPAERTEEASMSESSEPLDPDDVTAVSWDGDPPRKLVPPPPERGTIPVQVGPPPEAVTKPLRLPDELFRPRRTGSGGAATRRDPVTTGWSARTWVPAGLACAVLLTLAVLLGWYVLR